MGCRTIAYDPDSMRFEQSFGYGSAVRFEPRRITPPIDRAAPTNISATPTAEAIPANGAGQAGQPERARGPKTTSAKRKNCATTYHSPRSPLHQGPLGATAMAPLVRGQARSATISLRASTVRQFRVVARAPSALSK